MTTDKNTSLGKQKLLAVLLIIVALLLLVFKIYADSEPGAIPLLLLIVGTGWYFITRYRIRSQSHTH